MSLLLFYIERNIKYIYIAFSSKVSQKYAAEYHSMYFIK